MRGPEGLIIRPPSEAGSLLLRVVRGCHWNRCQFCGIYEAYGQPFETRPVEDVLEDIDLLKQYWETTHAPLFSATRTPWRGLPRTSCRSSSG